ncbi:DUF2480 family protein [Capnocytophaga canis]|uniref:DUF2480 family protein n=1 Tax=Capnocytophaga canis TaxID=1848903 RepID=UPI0015620F7C|nr:DUF2480 family protein [Capnocytophaga canis]
MTQEIVNRVTKSALEIFDLEDYYPNERRLLLDIKEFLHEGFILREKEFREALDSYSWETYENAYVAIYCSTEAILPAWTFILIASKLQPYAKKIVQGDLQSLEVAIFQDIIAGVDISYLIDKPVIVKGCSKKTIPEEAYVMAVQRIQPIARSVMFGEACSAVPIYKRKNM